MRRLIFILICIVWLAASCSPLASDARQPDSAVLASTTFLADITRNVAGNRTTVDSLLPAGTDPHSYQPTPQDIAKIERSKLLIVNGAKYERFLDALLKNVGGERTVVVAAADVGSEKDALNGQGVDPHLWLDPNLVVGYVENIRAALTAFDPGGAAVYQSNAKRYVAQLKELDGWIKTQVGQIPLNKRLLVTNHEAFGYFAKRYGFKVVGAVIPSFSGNAAPSAQQMANLIDEIRKLNAPAVFLDTADNDALAQQIAAETNVTVINDLHLESLTEGAPAATYLDMLKYDVSKIVAALK